MKKTIALVVCLVCMVLQQSIACTTFFINKNGQLIFGRNYDWITDAGMVCTNMKGLSKTSLPTGNNNTISWISRYGSITFNQYGKELPTGGMNEMGLVVELMWLDGSKYPAADNRPAVHLLQWIQYQLDNHSTVEEVIASDEKIRISSQNPPCHFLVADASGKVATIEFLKGKLVVHKEKELPFPVLTNSTYEESAMKAQGANIAAGNTNFSFQDNSLQRFARACSMVQQFHDGKVKKPVVDYAFEILDKVESPGYTKWSIVYDLKEKKIYFKTADFHHIKILAFSAFSFDCATPALALNMNQSMRGDIRKLFLPHTDKLNREIVERAVYDSKSEVPITEEEREATLAYAKSIRCKD